MVSQTTSLNEKAGILEIVRDGYRDELKRMFQLTYDNYVNFWISQQKVDSTSSLEMEKKDLWGFFDILDALSTRKVTGNRARDMVVDYLKSFTPEDIYWCNRILARDFKVGAAYGIFRDLYPDEKLIEGFGLQLCGAWDKNAPLGRKRIFDYKMNGLRGLIFIDNEGRVDVKTRSGKQGYNWELIVEEILATGLKGVVLDGEFMGKNFEKSAAFKASKSTAGREGLRFYPWDIVKYDEWYTPSETPPQLVRRLMLDEWLGAHELTRTTRIDWAFTDDDSELYKWFEQAATYGFEGLVIKNPEAPYTWGRDQWFKWKPRFTDTFTITAVYEGNGARKGMAGGIKLRGIPREYFDFHAANRANEYSLDGVLVVETRCGSGLKKKDCIALWKDPDSFIGREVEIYFDCVTEDGSIRFPIFRRFVDAE